MSIADMRTRSADLALERNGFVLLSAPSAVTDFYDTAQVRSVYYTELKSSRCGCSVVRKCSCSAR